MARPHDRVLDCSSLGEIARYPNEPVRYVMTTKLDGELKREILIDGAPYTLTITTDKFVLALKGKRKGLEIQWAHLVSGEAALATALKASLTANIAPARADASVATKAKDRKAKRRRPLRRG